MKKIVLLLMIGVFSAQSAIITFNFNGTNPGQNSPWNTGTTIDPDASDGNGFALGGGTTGTAANNRFDATHWGTSTESAALTGNNYFGFVLTIGSDYAANLDNAQITFTLQSSYTGSSGTGPQDYALFSSSDGFTVGNELQSGTIANTENLTYTFASSGLENETGNIEFRAYGWGATSTAGTMSINAFSLGGTISAVPEPATWGAISAFGLLGICGLREWRQRKQAQGA